MTNNSTKRDANVGSYEKLYTNVHSNIIYNNQKIKTQMFIDLWIYKSVWYVHTNVIILSNKIEWSSDTSYNMNEPPNIILKWEEPVTIDYVLYECIY
jgi:hypothetical protein